MRNGFTKKRSKPGDKFITAAQAVLAIPPNSTLVTGGFIGSGFPESLAIALEQRFLRSQLSLSENSLSGLTLVYAGGQGDNGERGLNHLAHPGLLSCIIGGHWGLVPKLQKLVISNQVEAYKYIQA